MSESCPKCGSIQIQHDQCLKCGVIISKARAAAESRKEGVSYVAPQQPSSAPQNQPPSYSWQSPTMTEGPVIFTSSRKNQRLKTNLVFLAVLMLLAGGAYKIYRYFMHQASGFAGQYRNTQHAFALRFPETGKLWNHYQQGDLKDERFKDAVDGFYKGDDPDDPDIVMAVWTETVRNPVPANLDDRTAAGLLKGIESELLHRMEKAKMKCDILQSRKQYLAGGDGFLIHADLTGKRTTMRTMIYCAFDTGRAVTVQFIGRDKHLIENEKEIEGMMATFGFDTRIF